MKMKPTFRVKYVLYFCALWTLVLIVLVMKTLPASQDQNVQRKSGFINKHTVLDKDVRKNVSLKLGKNNKILYEQKNKNTEYHGNTSYPGYGGEAVHVDRANLSLKDAERYDAGYKQHHLNQFVSDLIPLRRTLMNVLQPRCLNQKYNIESLKTTGVVIIFHNEAWSVLLRTVHSILDNTPSRLLSDIILVDDASTLSDLGRPLDDYVLQLEKVKVIRMKTRVGLMVARNNGCLAVTGQVCFFLDAHCEVAQLWLEPLLERIQADDRIMAVPSTDYIDSKTFQYNVFPVDQIMRGGMDLDLYFNWIPQSKSDNLRRADSFSPMWSPTHLGCCFAISKSTFLHLGMYDPGLKIWGCENIELSFKIWMCGGRIEIVPCSHVAHLFRYMAPWSWGSDDPDILTKNCLRVSEVWMDEYKVLYHDRIFNRHTELDFGDVSQRKALRKSLGCRSFDWYVNNVYPELYIPTQASASGQIRNLGMKDLCVESPVHRVDYGKHVGVVQCSKHALIQHFTLTKEHTIRRDDGCLDYDGSTSLIVKDCASSGTWKYTKDNTIVHSSSGLCLRLNGDGTLAVGQCDNSALETWAWERKTIRKPTAASWATLFDKQQGIFYMHFPTYKTVHTMAFDEPVVEHWLEWNVAKTAYGSTEKDRSDDEGKSFQRPSDLVTSAFSSLTRGSWMH